ncbi:probable ADP-ribosylation factor GTPase-activating protein AGD14 isoform X2 [Olea europaea var. sylvestris]|uniref:probable ADP-ribosylation factor GTPase-activating protein AGD14 isoform X2 n=1 Tax=Olea europaea var. sylvestris TaxID=158386 RepID=UPI000C1D51E2|nr:probable ADP-ribosylation factor GTPase-activating protein AGD14 isoform X2 [Olea europaea var. sylvestris]
MSSRKEEERNEKIIRGLMKLPPNRRCINCNSLGPQYVCTNFWTFVCITCSGIHREFTHRVKSVSMAKFTSQEVEALQKGGNQRAREIFLTAWDPQRHRLPDNSNVNKVRDFIKDVFVDKRYALDKSSDRPPRYTQNAKGLEDETRRASSYHSYSQSPPYDFQYEERRYGKHASGLTRKPGSDRGLYGGKLSSFLSPGRASDRVYEDMFANEGSNPRASDYSVSNGGYSLGSDVLLPSSQKDIGRPFSAESKDSSSEFALHRTVSNHSDAYTNGGRMLHPQRTASLGSFGSFDSSSMPFTSVNSFNLLEIASESEQSAETSHNKLSSTPSQPQCSISGNFDGLDLFSAPFAPQNVTSASLAACMTKFPESSPAQSVDLFQQSSIPSVPTLISHQPSQTLPSSSLDLFAEMPQQQFSACYNGKFSKAMSKNEGWATFDIPQNTSSMGIENSTSATKPSSDRSFLGNIDSESLVHKPSSQDSSDHRPSPDMSTLWHEGAQNIEVTPKVASIQSWNAFEDSKREQIIENTVDSEPVATLHTSDANQYLGFSNYEALGNDLIQRSAKNGGPSLSSISSHASVLLHDFHMLPSVDGLHSNLTNHKSFNPFDLPDDYDVESSNMFWDMSSLQSALPNSSIPTSDVDGVTQSWFPQNPFTSYVPGEVSFDPPIGSLGLIGQAPSNQIPNVPAQGPVVSIGGNPFA